MNTQAQRSHISSFNKPLLLWTSRFNCLLCAEQLAHFIRDAKTYKNRHMLWLLIGTFSISLPAAGYMLATLSGAAGTNLTLARTVSVFISTDNAVQSSQEIAATLRRNQQVYSALVIQNEVETINVEADPVAMLEIIPEPNLDSPSIHRLIEQLQSLPGVEHVEFDQSLLTRNVKAQTYLRVATSVLYALASLLTVLIVRYLVKRDVTGGSALIALKTRLGATPMQIRKPFLYRSAFTALFVSVVGILIVSGLLMIARYLVDHTSNQYHFTTDIRQVLLLTGVVLTTSLAVTIHTLDNIISFINR